MPPWADALSAAKGERDRGRVVDALLLLPPPFECRRAFFAVAVAAGAGAGRAGPAAGSAGGGGGGGGCAWKEALGIKCFWVWVELWVVKDPPGNLKLGSEDCVIRMLSPHTMHSLESLRLDPEWQK